MLRAEPRTQFRGAHGAQVDLGGLTLRGWATPGHTDEHQSYVLFDGGGQEQRLRAGTEDVACTVGFGEAADLATLPLANGETARLTSLRDRLEGALDLLLQERVPLNGHLAHATRHTPT